MKNRIQLNSLPPVIWFFLPILIFSLPLGIAYSRIYEGIFHEFEQGKRILGEKCQRAIAGIPDDLIPEKKGLHYGIGFFIRNSPKKHQADFFFG